MNDAGGASGGGQTTVLNGIVWSQIIGGGGNTGGNSGGGTNYPNNPMIMGGGGGGSGGDNVGGGSQDVGGQQPSDDPGNQPHDDGHDDNGHDHDEHEHSSSHGTHPGLSRPKSQPQTPRGLQNDPKLVDMRERQRRVIDKSGGRQDEKPLGYTMADVRAKAHGNDPAHETLLIVSAGEKPISPALHDTLQKMSSYRRHPELRPEAHGVVDMLIGLRDRIGQPKIGQPKTKLGSDVPPMPPVGGSGGRARTAPPRVGGEMAWGQTKAGSQERGKVAKGETTSRVAPRNSQSGGNQVIITTTSDVPTFITPDDAAKVHVNGATLGSIGPTALSTLPAGNYTVIERSSLNPYVLFVEDASGGRHWINAYGAGITNINTSSSPVFNTQMPQGQSRPSPTNIYPLDVPNHAQVAVFQFGVRVGKDGNSPYDTVPDNRHPGMDFVAPAGTDVVAITGGEVVGFYIPRDSQIDPLSPYSSAYANTQTTHKGQIIDPRNFNPANMQSSENSDRISGFLGSDAPGAYVVVRTGNTYIVYAHLDPSTLQVGEYVTAGQVIGEVGQYSAEGGNEHLHLEVRTSGQLPAGTKPLYVLNPSVIFAGSVIKDIDQGLSVWDTTNPSNTNVVGSTVETQNTMAIDLGTVNHYIYAQSPPAADIDDPNAHAAQYDENSLWPSQPHSDPNAEGG